MSALYRTLLVCGSAQMGLLSPQWAGSLLSNDFSEDGYSTWLYLLFPCPLLPLPIRTSSEAR